MMATAKDLIVQPIDSASARAFVKAHHYSGKVTNNIQLHLGVFLNSRLHGVMQFGPSLDKRKIQGLVEGTKWHEFLELNRMAFDDILPRNSESRALSIAFRMIRKNAPQVKWIISFADATQCGDGTIYRAAGFVLTAIKKNDQIWIAPDQARVDSRLTLTNGLGGNEKDSAFGKAIDNRFTESKKVIHTVAIRTNGNSMNNFALTKGAASMKPFIEAGFKPLDGFQLRYIYFLDPAYRARLKVPILPFSDIARYGAGMYKGQKRGEGETDNAAQSNVQTEGARPISPLLQDDLPPNL